MEEINDFEWFAKKFSKELLNKFAGKWVAIKNQKVISFGYDFNEVIKEANCEVDNPLLIKIPKEKEILIL